MYARITHTHHDPYRLNEAIDRARQNILPAARRQAGFRGYIMLVDRGTGGSMTITLWEDEDSREVTGEESGYYHDALCQIIPLLSAEPFIEDLEVAIQE